ncbi:hypothetical protein [Nonomuraea sp. KM90]|uniref:hypothetical protein n=1 Tax=Nonomuraea sp. KM90 TaxID=3457428 RepID=UPI003FCC30ED
MDVTIWAVGTVTDEWSSEPAAAHFDGRPWQRTPLPAVTPAGSDVQLTSVLAVAPDDVWAAGNYQTPEGNLGPLLFRWNGTAWRAVAVGKEGELTGLSRDGGTVWVVGNETTSVPSYDSFYLLTHAQGRWSRFDMKLPLAVLAHASGTGRLWGLAGNKIMEYR